MLTVCAVMLLSSLGASPDFPSLAEAYAERGSRRIRTKPCPDARPVTLESPLFGEEFLIHCAMLHPIIEHPRGHFWECSPFRDCFLVHLKEPRACDEGFAYTASLYAAPKPDDEHDEDAVYGTQGVLKFCRRIEETSLVFAARRIPVDLPIMRIPRAYVRFGAGGWLNQPFPEAERSLTTSEIFAALGADCVRTDRGTFIVYHKIYDAKQLGTARRRSDRIRVCRDADDRDSFWFFRRTPDGRLKTCARMWFVATFPLSSSGITVADIHDEGVDE